MESAGDSPGSSSSCAAKRLHPFEIGALAVTRSRYREVGAGPLIGDGRDIDAAPARDEIDAIRSGTSD